MDKSMSVNKLLVSWKGPNTKENYFVGMLQKSPSGYRFKYNKEIVEAAKKEGFTPFIGLNNLNTEYERSKLFSVFERRLPNKNRNIYKMVVREHNLNTSSDIDWEYLRISKGQLATDSLSFLEPVVYRDEFIYYKGEIAGWSHTKDNNREFTLNDHLNLKTDTIDNPFEKQAVELIDPKNGYTRVGYIPQPYNELFFQLLSKGYKVEASIYSLEEYSSRPTVEIKTTVKLEDIKSCGCDYLISYH